MGNIPCSLNCDFQTDGICKLDKASNVSCTNGKCPHYRKKKGSAKFGIKAKDNSLKQ